MAVKRTHLFAGIALVLLCTSCSSNSSGSGQATSQASYKDMKSIVIDVLKSDEAQQAIQKASSKSQDTTMKLLSTGDGQQIQMAVKDLLTTDAGSKIIETTMKDPKFASDFAKSVQKQNKQLHKDLMRDPEYQKQMLDMMSTNPEYQKLIMDSMKSQQYRQQMAVVISETMKGPLFQGQLLTLLSKAVEEQSLKQTSIGQKAAGGQQGGKGGSQGGGSAGSTGSGGSSGSNEGGDSGGDNEGGDSGGGNKKKKQDESGDSSEG